MITFILPGYSAKNKDWALDIADELEVDHEIRPVLWEHWMDSEKRFIPQKKADDLMDVLKADHANIIAKSVGTLVAAAVVKKIPAQIEKVILCGIPSVSPQRLKIFQESFKNFPAERIIVIQNSRDPLGPYDKVKEFMAKVYPKIKVIEKPRSDHHYPYPEDFNKFLKS